MFRKSLVRVECPRNKSCAGVFTWPVRPAILCVLYGVICVQGDVLEVPDNYPLIQTALDSAGTGDTILVHPGQYFERLLMPDHNFSLLSEYHFSDDSVDLLGTVIDATPFADSTYASVLTFLGANDQSTLISGFTLTGGHGRWYGYPENPGKWGGAVNIEGASPTILHCRIVGNTSFYNSVLLAEYSTARIAHCEIAFNCGARGLVSFLFNIAMGDSAVFEWNNVHDNYVCLGEWPQLLDNRVEAQMSSLIVRNNHFHDYAGVQFIGVELWASRGVVHGNVFERVRAPWFGEIVMSNDFGNIISDNVFRDCQVEDGSAISLQHGGGQPHNTWTSIVRNNWMENLTNSLPTPCGVYMQRPNAEFFGNAFVNCTCSHGVVQMSQTSTQGCEVEVRNNVFWGNSTGGAARGSCFNAIGGAPECLMRDNWFEGNVGRLIAHELIDDSSFDCSNNYWGDPSGPYHPTENPQGQGDTVDVNIHVTPWLAEPPDLEIDVRARLKLNPEDWTLEQIFPNPFNGQTNIRIVASKPQPMSVIVYNTLGQKISDVWQGVIAKDEPTLIRWDGVDNFGRGVASGVYYIVAEPRGSLRGAPKAQKAVLLR